MGVPAGLIGRLMLYFAGKGNIAVSNVPRIWVLSLAKLASCLIAFAASINATTGSGKVSGEAKKFAEPASPTMAIGPLSATSIGGYGRDRPRGRRRGDSAGAEGQGCKDDD